MTDDVATDEVVIERRFDAPIEVVWSMWTEAEHFAEWYGPTGATIPVCEIDLRVGGRRRVAMEMATPDGPMRMWFAGEHLEIDPPHRIVYTEFVADEHGQPSSDGPHAVDGSPSATEVHVELRAVDGGTEMRLRHVGVPADSPGAAGWAMALDDLAARLAARS